MESEKGGFFSSPGSALQPHRLGAEWEDGDSLLGAACPGQLFRIPVEGAELQRHRKSEDKRDTRGRGPIRAPRPNTGGHVFPPIVHRARHQGERRVHQQEFHHQ